MEIDPSNFDLPAGFVMPKSYKTVSDSDGVSKFQYGNDEYVAWRFAFEARPWKIEKVRKYGIDGSDTIPVILFYRDKDNTIPIKLRRKMIFEERMNRFGEPFDKRLPAKLTPREIEEGKTELDLWELPIGFDSEVFKLAFERFKMNGSKPGTPLTAWRADPGQVSTLGAMGLFTVEDFGGLTEESFKEKIKSLPPSAQTPLLTLHEAAIAYTAAQTGNFDLEKYGQKLDALESSNESLREELEAKEAELAEMRAKIKGTTEPEVPSEEKSKTKTKRKRIRRATSQKSTIGDK